MTAEVRVPATSANMGAGFDTMGIALALYNTIKVTETDGGLKIINQNSFEYIPVNETNLIYRSIERAFDEVGYRKRGLEIVQNSRIPMTRGLGSSSACIVGGLLAGNAISGHKLPYSRLLELATEIEGHPDNVVPAFYGGFCISVRDGGRVLHRSFKLSGKIRYAIMVPDFFVATKKSRGVLPEKVGFADAAHNVSRAVWLAASLAGGKLDNLKPGVDDRLHQPYRKSYIGGMDEIFDATYRCGSKATFLSGSGPTILSMLEEKPVEFKRNMNEFFKERAHKWSCRIIEIDNVGAVVKCK